MEHLLLADHQEDNLRSAKPHLTSIKTPQIHQRCFTIFVVVSLFSKVHLFIDKILPNLPLTPPHTTAEWSHARLWVQRSFSLRFKVYLSIIWSAFTRRKQSYLARSRLGSSSSSCILKKQIWPNCPHDSVSRAWCCSVNPDCGFTQQLHW